MVRLGVRIDKLERKLGLVAVQKLPRVIVSRSGWCLALDRDRCMEILNECGYLRGGMGIIDFLHFPLGLTAQEMEAFLRERGAEICRLQR